MTGESQTKFLFICYKVAKFGQMFWISSAKLGSIEKVAEKSALWTFPLTKQGDYNIKLLNTDETFYESKNYIISIIIL